MPHRALLAALRPALEEVLPARAAARPLPRAVFVDPASLALDEAALFRGRWVAIASRAALEDPGSWVRVGWPGRSDLIAARTADLQLALLAATCRHRGVPLVAGEAGRVRALSLVCPYHGWTYDLAGCLRRAPGLDAAHPAAELGLRAGSAAVLGNVVLGALDAGRPVPAHPEVPGWIGDATLDALRRVHESAHEVSANWKLLVGNFQEAHHFPRVHPALEARTPFTRSSSIIPEDAPGATGAWLGGVMDLHDDVETVSGTGRLDGRPFVVPAEHRRRVHDAWVAPNLLLSLQPDYLLSYRLEPTAVDRTRVVFAIDVHAAARPASIADGVEDLVAFWSTINAEDRAICEAQQRGLAGAGPGYRGGPYAESEDGLHAFEQRVARAYLALEESRP